MPVLSFIVAAYNAEKEIERCLDSILNQTVSDIEVIVVDDGSTDNTLSICNEFKKKDKRLTVIHKENSGVSDARNAGLKVTTGDYIAFVDSDDWLAVDFAEKCLDKLAKEKSDLVICGYYNVFPTEIVACGPFPVKVNRREDLFLNDIPCFIWNKVYSKIFKHDLKFPSGVAMGEDTAVLLPLLSKINSYSVINDSLYYYSKSGNSTTTQLHNAQKMSTYVKGLEIAIKKANPKYVNEISYSVAKRIMLNKDWFLKYCFGDVIDYVNENLYSYFVNNPYVLNNPKTSPIVSYKQSGLIDKIIYYDHFGKKALSDVEKACIDSWKANNIGYEVVELSEKNCPVKELPDSLKEQYKKGDYSSVGFYFKLKKIYETGGFALSSNVYANKSFGGLRVNSSFFTLKNASVMSEHVFGAKKENQAIKELIDSYDGLLYSDQEIVPATRIRENLIWRHGYKGETWSINLEDGVALYSAEFLSYSYSPENICMLVDEVSIKTVGTDFYYVDKSLVDLLYKQSRERWMRINELQGKLKNLTVDYNLLNEYKQTIDILSNSTSWRMTKPFRVIGKFLRKIFKHERS